MLHNNQFLNAFNFLLNRIWYQFLLAQILAEVTEAHRFYI